MEALKSYLLTAMLASLAASLLIRITDEGYRKYVRLIAGLALLLLLVKPLFTLADAVTDGLTDLERLPESTDDGGEQGAFIGEMGRTMSREVGDLIAKRFGLLRDTVSVKLTLDLSDLSAISIYRIEVTVTSDCDTEQIRKYLEESFDCSAEVVALHDPK